MTEVYIADVSCLKDGALYERTLYGLSEERRKRVAAYAREEDGRLCAGAGALLAFALKRHGLGERDIEFLYGDNGKPRLKNGGVCFNISHSGNFAVCALSDGEVGIDIERVKPHGEKLYGRVLSERERRFCLSSPDKELAFTRLWTLKESFLKLYGKGISALGGLEIVIDCGVSALLDGQRRSACFREYPVDGYCLTACALSGKFAEDLITVDMSKL